MVFCGICGGKNVVKKTLPKQLIIFLAVGLVYFLLTLPQIILNFPDGRSALRISGFIPIVAGLLYGPLGAAACGVGNFLADATGHLQMTDFIGSFGVFVMGYMPYRLWHRLFLSSKSQPVFLESVGSVLKYVFIAVVATFSATAIGAIGGQLLHEYSFWGFFPQVALQYFDLSVAVGMLLFQILSQYTGIRPCIPKNAYRTNSSAYRFVLDYILCILVAGLSVVLLVLSYQTGAVGSPMVDILCALLFLCIVLLLCLPSCRKGEAVKTKEDYKPKGSLQRQMITMFLFLLCAVLVFYAISMIIFFFLYYSGHEGVELWTRVLISIAGACIVLLLMLSLLLKWVEVHLTNPIRMISLYAGNFVENGSLTQKNLSLPKSSNEIDGLGLSLAKMTDSLRKYIFQLKEKTAEEERRAVEMNTARDIQMSMLNKDWHVAAPFELAAKTQPAQEVGGDFYDFLRLSEKKMFVVIADVSGKGISAALFMMRAKTLLSGQNHVTLKEAIIKLNDKLVEQNETMMFVTVFAGVVDCEKMTFRYVNAGHNPALVHQNGVLSVLNTAPDFAIGPIEGAQYTEHCIPISDDFRLLFYTDGITEAENENNEFFGMERLLAVAERTLGTNMPAQKVIDGIEQEINTFANGAKQADDITMLCLSLGDADKLNHNV